MFKNMRLVILFDMILNPSFNPKAGLFEGSFFWGGVGEGQFDPLCIPLRRNFPLGGNSACNLFIFVIRGLEFFN